MSMLPTNVFRNLRLMPALALAAWLAIGNTAAAPRAASAPDAFSAPTQTIPQPSLERLKKGLRVAPQDRRVDLSMPVFTHPTRITNPLFPIGSLHSAVLLGHIDHRVFRSETTLLKDTKTIRWMGLTIEVLQSQYVAFLDGRIDEVAIDWYAQSDDGAVWYLGEDVFNYEDGAVADREGTWVAGDDGPAAMIMPATPRVGDVFRPENAPGSVFEEVEVKAIGLTVDGPRGRVMGAIATEELHMDGHLSPKIFAPAYGEFHTSGGGELEALAIAVPTDAIAASVPIALKTLEGGAATIFDAARTGDWSRATSTLKAMQSAWTGYRGATAVPPLLAAQMDRTLAALSGDATSPGVQTHEPSGAMHASKSVALAALDLQLRFRPPLEIDRARFVVWARQLILDSAGSESGAVAGDVSTLEWIRDRFVHAMAPAEARRLGAQLAELRVAADAEDLTRAARGAAALHSLATTP